MGDCSDDGDGHVVRWTSDSDHSEGVSHVIGASLYLMTVLVSTTLNLMLVDVFMKVRVLIPDFKILYFFRFV